MPGADRAETSAATITRPIFLLRSFSCYEPIDSYILAEAALANCTILITSDDYTREVDSTLLSLTLKSCDVGVILVRTPAEILRQFGRKR